MAKHAAFSAKELHVVFEAVFRDSTIQPGFYYQDLGKQIDSKTFRQRMVALKDGLSNICELRLNKQLNYQWVGRFNHQHASRFHRDSAEAHSFLMLGYEPTKVDSKVYVADYTKLIETQNISLETYFGGSQDINTAADDKLLVPKVKGELISCIYLWLVTSLLRIHKAVLNQKVRKK